MKQLIVFFILSNMISWMIWLPLYGHVFGLNNFPQFRYQHGAGALGPLIAAFMTTFYYNGLPGIKKSLKQCSAIRPIIYLCIALFAPFILAFICSFVISLSNETTLSYSNLLIIKEFPEFNFFTFCIYNLICFGFGEEVGWRGFALPRFQNRFNALNSSLILTFFWALWHLPLFFYRPGMMSMAGPEILGWLFSLFTGSILLSWLYNSARGSILICAIFHTTIDIVFTGDFGESHITNYLGFLITVWGIATIIIFKPKNLSKDKQVTG